MSRPMRPIGLVSNMPLASPWVVRRRAACKASFAAYDVLEDLHAIATGDYELEDDGDIDDDYDVDEATETQEDLAQEPAR